MSQKLNGGGWERVSQVADLAFKNCNLAPKTASFCTKPLENLFETAKQKEMVATLHMQLDLLVSKSPLGPSNSTICSRNAPKWHSKAPEFVHIGCCQLHTKNRPYLGLRGSKCDFEGT